MGTARAINLAYLVAFACVPVAMLAGLQRSRAYRAEAVSALVDRLDRPLGPDGLRDALAYALDDPTLEVAYPRARACVSSTVRAARSTWGPRR